MAKYGPTRKLWEITRGHSVIEAMWNCGLDTYDIAKALMIHESQIANALAKMHDKAWQTEMFSDLEAYERKVAQDDGGLLVIR